MSNPKERHYWAQLRSALTSGQWRSPHPARTPNGTPIPWPELLRKFNKHCRGYSDIAEVAAQTQALCLLLGARYADDDEHILLPELGLGSGDFVELGVEEVGVLAEERIEEAMVGYNVLKSLEASKFDTIHLALAHYSFSLRRPADCLSYLQKVPELLQYHSHIPTAPDSVRSNGLLAPSSYAPSTTSFAGSFSSSSGIDATTPEIRDGRVWAMTETIRSLCLEGMSLELLHTSDPRIAVNSYRKALPLLSTLQTELGLNPKASGPKSPHKLDLSLFSQIREIWRWVERLLWRAVVLSAKTCDVFLDEPTAVSPESTSGPALESRTSSTSTVTPKSASPAVNNSLWTWLRHYNNCSAFWPPTFRSKHRSTVCVIHLRAFVLRFGGAPSIPPSPSPLPSISSKSSLPTNQQISWRAEALEVVNAYRSVLTATTTFPRAGERNVAVEEFAEIAVALWEAGWVVNHGAGKQAREGVSEDLGASWVIDLLQWSQTLTFNSSLVLRHLTRLLYLSATSPVAPAPKNNMLAKRTLQLYIQVVGKAWEASKEGVGEDMDADVRWVETLVFGARMLVSDVARYFQVGRVDSPRYSAAPPASSSGHATHSSFTSHFAGHSPAGMAQQGQLPQGPSALHAPLEDDEAQVTEVHEAMEVLGKARLRLDIKNKRLLGEVLLAEGIILGLLGVVVQDPLDRTTHFQKAHGALLRSIEVHPTPSAYYHLALSFARRFPSTDFVAPTVNFTSSPPAAGDPQAEDPYIHIYSLTRALECAGSAVEGCPKDVRYWHLLGLLLTATENWSGAREVLDRGEELDLLAAEATSQPAGSSGDGESDDDESQEDAETGEAFVVVGTNGTTKETEAKNDRTGRPKHKRSASTIMGNGVAAGAIHSSTPMTTTVLDPNASSLPSTMSLLAYLHPSSHHSQNMEPYAFTFDQYPPSPSVVFERHLQLRMSQIALAEVMDGPEGAEEGWLEVFAWVAEKQREMKTGSAVGAGAKEGAPAERPEMHEKAAKLRMYRGPSASTANVVTDAVNPPEWSRSQNQSLEVPIGITISPATPEIETHDRSGLMEQQSNIIVSEPYDEKDSNSLRGRRVGEDEKRHNLIKKKEKAPSLHDKEKADSRAVNHAIVGGLHPKSKRSLSSDRSGGGGDTSKSKKVQQMLKNRVDKGRAGISAVSRKIGHGVVKNGVRRTNSTPDFHAVLQPTSYQASSIHSRRRLSSIIHSSDEHEPQTRTTTPIPGEWTNTPPYSVFSSPQRDFSTSSPSQTSNATSNVVGARMRNAHEDRLMSELWLMSAATFRRLGKIDQAKGAIQEAELRDETNPNVWVQLGLYYGALRLYQHAIDTLQKARFIAPDDVSATVHLARLYLDPEVTSKLHHTSNNKQSAPRPPVVSSVASSPDIPQQSTSATNTATPPPAAEDVISSASGDIDLAAGMLAQLTKSQGWDVPEAWYFLSKAYALQGRKEKERAALVAALELSEGRAVRYMGRALGWCL